MAIFKLGNIINPTLFQQSTVETTINGFTTGIENYFQTIFADLLTKPFFNIQGTITQGVSAVPMLGICGTLSTFTIIPMQKAEWDSFIKPLSEQEILSYQFYTRLAKVLKSYISTKIILAIDAKGISAPMQMYIPQLEFLDTAWGIEAQTHMDSIKADNRETWLNNMNIIGDMIWKYVMPVTVAYTSPCAGGEFIGSATVSFNLI